MSTAREVLTLERVESSAAWDGECLLWKGAMANGTCPVCRLGGKQVTVRHALWTALGRRRPPKTSVLAQCKESRCVSPDHLVLASRGPKPGMRRSAATRENMAAARRAASKLTPEDVQAIRMSTAKLKDLVVQYGMSKRAIQDIRSGASWADLRTPFSGLGAR